MNKETNEEKKEEEMDEDDDGIHASTVVEKVKQATPHTPAPVQFTQGKKNKSAPKRTKQ